MQEELGAVLLPGIDSIGIVSVDAAPVYLCGPGLPYQQDRQQDGAVLDGALCVEPTHWPHL